MDDELWVLKQIDERDDVIGSIIGQDVESDSYELGPEWRYFGREYDRKWAPACRQAQRAEVKILHSKPALRRRQLRSRRYSAWQRSLHADRSFGIRERQRIAGYVLQKDVADQIDDYRADQVSDIPSVSMTIGNSRFAENHGEYPYDYSDGYDDEDTIDEDSVPQWFKDGFENEREYVRYLNEISWFHEPAWDDDTYETT